MYIYIYLFIYKYSYIYIYTCIFKAIRKELSFSNQQKGIADQRIIEQQVEIQGLQGGIHMCIFACFYMYIHL
jgi:hypothetical protein